MRMIIRVLLIVLVTLAGLAAAGLQYVRSTGLVARSTPGALEAALARRVRSLAIPRDVSARRNPIAPSPEILAAGRAHYADHCAVCHANDGSGKTEMGQSMWPRAPDMRLAPTQELSDSELFWIIENGVRFTGMPGWGTGTSEGEAASWHLVHFIRHLPDVGEAEIEEMEALNPRSKTELLEEIEAERFLQGDDVAPANPPAHVH